MTYDIWRYSEKLHIFNTFFEGVAPQTILNIVKLRIALAGIQIFRER